MKIPNIVPNIINDKEILSESNSTLDNINPHDNSVICQITNSDRNEVDLAIEAAKASQKEWGSTPGVNRGKVLFEIIDLMNEHREVLADAVARETGKSMAAAKGEVQGAIDLGRYFAAEGQRLHGRTTTSAVPGKQVYHILEPMGVAGLIISSNTPIANVAWKVFPALICGNSAVLKASEDAPLTSYFFGKIAMISSLPDGVLNIIQGSGAMSGQALIEHPGLDVISFTGSSHVGKIIAQEAAKRLTKVSLELGGKNPLLIDEEVDMENAVNWVLLSGFSNAGQRCAAASRIIVLEKVYNEFRDTLVSRTNQLSLGVQDNDDLGPVMNEKQLNNMLSYIDMVKADGGTILCGGEKSTQLGTENGFYMEPTIVENIDPGHEFSCTELFGPIITLYKVKDFEDGLTLCNDSDYGLTSCIHTTNFKRAIEFTRRIESGVANVNGPTYGSEPHLPFGGVKNSGNGSREPGLEAVSFYSNFKTVSYIL